tara:strand:+ start:257 stop:475 length:219 start_codon:yes stop_codon:yes gene_type:complete
MTYPAPNPIPYDPWFDSSYKYDPCDDMPLPINDRFDMYDSSDAHHAYSPHQQSYDLAVAYRTTIGGSENVKV